jgi:hypothetical protein
MEENPLKVVDAEIIEEKPAEIAENKRVPIKYKPGYEKGKQLSDRTRLPNGLTKQEEKFCQLYKRYGPLNARQAYNEAGYVDPGDKFWAMKVKKLIARRHIEKRLSEIQDSAEEYFADLSKEQFEAKCLKMAEEAKEQGDFKAAKEFMALLGQSKGFIIDRKVSLEGKVISKDNNATPEERMEKIKKLTAILGMK